MGNLTDELFVTLIVIGLLFTGFSKLKNELGIIHRLRLKALYLAVLINCALLAVISNMGFWAELMGIVFIKKWNGFSTYFFYSPLALLFIFVTIFYSLLYKLKKGYRSGAVYFLPYKPYNISGKIAGVFLIVSSLASTLPVFKIDTNSDWFTGIFSIMLLFLLFLVWSKEKNENKEMTEIRLKAMQIAIYLNYFLFLLATWVIYGTDYLVVLNLAFIAVPIIFMVVFYVMRLSPAQSNDPAITPPLNL